MSGPRCASPAMLACFISVVVLMAAGCAGALAQRPPELLFYGSVPETAPRQGQAVVARAAAHGRDLAMVISHSASAPIRLNYMLDEYVAHTFDGRSVILSKGSFYDYPDLSGPGHVEPFTVSLPAGYSPFDIAQLRAKVNYGATLIVLQPIRPALQAPVQEPVISPPAPLGAASGGARGQVIAAWPAEPVIAPLPPTIGPGPRAPGRAPEPLASIPEPVWPRTPSPQPTASLPPAPEPPPIPVMTSREATGLAGSSMTVPTTLEFRQELGSRLQLAAQWNGGEALDISPGEQRKFQLIPGHHELAFVCRLPGIAETSGRVPVAAWPQQPVRIAIEARAHLTGADVRLRLWQGAKLVLDQDFSPDRPPQE